jgi:hypothetical protein
MEPGKSGPPSSLDLLRLRWTFTQEYLLSPDAFERECDRRSLSLRAGQLEELDRVGVLRPLYEMDASVATAQLRGATREMNSALDQGLVRRRAGPTFSPWPRSSITGELQYSIYQLLAIPVLRRFITSMTVKKPVDLSKGIRWTLAVWFRLKQQESVDRDIDKVALANALWPSLRTRLRERIQDEAEVRKIPIASTCLTPISPFWSIPGATSSTCRLPGGTPEATLR